MHEVHRCALPAYLRSVETAPQHASADASCHLTTLQGHERRTHASHSLHIQLFYQTRAAGKDTISASRGGNYRQATPFFYDSIYIHTQSFLQAAQPLT